jgi:hypothetical protein
LTDASATRRDGGVEIAFTREPEDDALDRVLREVHRAGGRVVACDFERSTLLDLLEEYEREHEGEGGRAAG